MKDTYDENRYRSETSPETTLCGWSKDEVFITNHKHKDLNDHRVPDVWYFNGHEYRVPSTERVNTSLKGFLIGKVFYNIPLRMTMSSVFDYNETLSLIIPFDIKDIKVTYSREKIDFDDKDTLNRVKDAIEDAKYHVEQEYANITNDVWSVITKNKKEYDYLTNLSPNTPTVTVDDICDMKTTIDKWTNNSGPNPIVTANLFKNLMLNSDKNLDNDLWLKTPFANQRFVERKLCTIVNCYNDWLRYANKDLTTKAYYAYAEKQATKMDATEAQEIINYISKTCASEIVELNNMMDDLDSFIK